MEGSAESSKNEKESLGLQGGRKEKVFMRNTRRDARRNGKQRWLQLA